MLTDEDIERISTKLVENVRKTHHDFWIDPQDHYDQHKQISTLFEIYETTRSATIKTFIGLFILGGLLIAGFAAGLGKIFGLK